MQVDSTMVVNTGSDIVLLSGQKHNTHSMYGENGRMTTAESSHKKADFFGVLRYKDCYIRIGEGDNFCIVPINKFIGYPNAFK
jgi:hypothetical protein